MSASADDRFDDGPPDSDLWERAGYTVALVGGQALLHRELVERTGYTLLCAQDGDEASELFSAGATVDALVLDFSATGRPPEAILLFARRTSAGAPVIALVPAELDEAYRRAFNAGARDVLPLPARSEDLVAAIDMVLEPRGLADALEEMRARSFDVESAHGVRDSSDAQRIIALGTALAASEQKVKALRAQTDQGTAVFRQQALDAITERDRLLEGKEALKKKNQHLRRQLRDRDAQLRLTEKACEELQRKLKNARTQRRELETRLIRVADVEHERAPYALVSEDLDASFGSTLEIGVVDPEEALAQREADAEKLNELDDLYKRYRASLIQVEKMRAVLKAEAGVDADDIPGLWDRPANAQVKHDLVSELENALLERDEAERRIGELEDELAALLSRPPPSPDDEALRTERKHHAETMHQLELARRDRDALKLALDDITRDRDGLRAAVAALETRLAALATDGHQAEQAQRALDEEAAAHRVTAARLEEVLASHAGDDDDLPSLADTWRRAELHRAEAEHTRKKLAAALTDRRRAEEELASQRQQVDSLRSLVQALSETPDEPGQHPHGRD